MRQSKLIELMRQLSRKQLRQFNRLLPALIPVQNNEIIQLYQYLLPFATQFASPHIERDKVLSALKWNSKKLADRGSQLLQKLNQCLAVDDLLSDPVEQQLTLMKVFNQMGLEKHLRSSTLQCEKLLERQSRKGLDTLQLQARLFELKVKSEQSHQRLHYPSLQAASDSLDKSFVAKKIAYLVEMVNVGKILDIPYRLHFAEEVKKWCNDQQFEDEPLITLYQAALQLTEHPKENQHFFHLNNLLEEHQQTIDPDTLKILNIYLLNHCTRKITQEHETSYYEHYLSINTRMIDAGLFLENGLLLPWRYSNLITIGLRTGRTEWATTFLNKYREYLPVSDQENIYNFNLAHCNYYKNEYDISLRLLLQLDLRDPLVAIAAKNLIAKIFWETDEQEQLLTFLENYRLYVYRQKLAKKHLKQQVKRFIDFTRRMAKIPDFEPEKQQALLDQLPPAGEIIEYEWLRRELSKKLSKHGLPTDQNRR